jgi:HAMP domain-containing protein
VSLATSNATLINANNASLITIPVQAGDDHVIGNPVPSCGAAKEKAMIQSSLLSNIAASMSKRWRGTSLTWKITGGFLGTLLIFGVLVITIFSHLTKGLLHEQINHRTLALATNLGDAAAGQITTKNSLALHVLVAKYALQEGVAYAFVEDRNGKILAHSLGGKFPAELQSEATLGERTQVGRRNLIFRSRPVYETQVPILAGQIGTAHVSIWEDIVEAEIQRALAPIIGLIGLLLLVGVILSWRLSGKIVEPIIRLRSIADTMSKGNLDTPVGIDSDDEIGELALSIERMRTSLKAAMFRLRPANPGSPLIHEKGEEKNEQVTA